MRAMLLTGVLVAAACAAGSSKAQTPIPITIAEILQGSAPAEAEFAGWDLEPGVAPAQLVMVARVSRVSRVTIVEGAKTDLALREYRFQPVRVLKGIFQRDELSMTASDLGLTREDGGAAPLAEGEFRLLILTQQGGGNPFGGGMPTFGCASFPTGATFAQRVPLLTGPDDPLVGVVETLIRVVDSPSRRERAGLAMATLNETDGLAAIPLLRSLQKRADWAARNQHGYATVVRQAGHESRTVRADALALLRVMLASGVAPREENEREKLAEALRSVIESDERETAVRVAAIEALGHLAAAGFAADWAPGLLVGQLDGAATYAERGAAAQALGQYVEPPVTPNLRQPADAVAEALAALPLDETVERETATARAAKELNRSGAEQLLIERLERSLAAGQSVQMEFVELGRMASAESLPRLLAAAARSNLSATERHYLAWALGRVGDDRAAVVLADWARKNDGAQESSLAALERLDSAAAARELRTQLKLEPNLAYKLRIARVLARHGMGDAYALATEHLADRPHAAAAAVVLAALNDPRTAKDLSAVVAAPPDRAWRIAALTGLAAVGDAEGTRLLGEILADERHPQAAEAAEAAGLAADAELLRPLARLVQSRNRNVAFAALYAIRRQLLGVRTSPRALAAADVSLSDVTDAMVAAGPELSAEIRAALAEAVAAITGDPYVDGELRSAGLLVARLLGGEQYAGLLAELADQAGLETTNSSLLGEVQEEQRRLARAAAGHGNEDADG
jgi:hypothetical protein